MERGADDGSVQHHGLPPGLRVQSVWTEEECRGIERDLNDIKVLADAGKFKTGTLDRTPLRSKYFFGYGYTYGAQVAGKGQEQLLPPECVDPIPDWVQDKLITKLEQRGLVEKGWINSAVVNDYMPGERRFCSEKSSAPKYLAHMPRGSVTIMDGFSADGITHGIRPEDLEGRRVSVVLRHVFPDAPSLQDTEGLLKPAQCGAPATATRRLVPSGSSLDSSDERANDASSVVASSVGITKRVFEFESAEDERPSKQRRSAIAVKMLQDIKGAYSDERSGNMYEISADGAVRVTFAPKAFGLQPQESTTWKMEVSGDKLICGKGELLPAGVRQDRLVWNRRDRVGSDLVWLRITDKSEVIGDDEADEQGGEQEDKPEVPQSAGQAALVAWLQGLQQPGRAPSPPQLTLWGRGRGDVPAAPPKLMASPPTLMAHRRPHWPRMDQILRPVLGHTKPATSPPVRMGRSHYGAGPGRPRPGIGAGTPLAFQRQTLATSLSPNHPGPFKAAAAAGLLGPRVVPREEERAPKQPVQDVAPEMLQPQPGDEELPEAHRRWYYKDAEGNVQGPYAAAVMSEWSRQGFFPETLLVKAEDDEEFSELGNGMCLLMASPSTQKAA